MKGRDSDKGGDVLPLLLGMEGHNETLPDFTLVESRTPCLDHVLCALAIPCSDPTGVDESCVTRRLVGLVLLVSRPHCPFARSL